MSGPVRKRTKGPNAIIHRAHRKSVGSRLIHPLPLTTPQWQTGPRHGLQVAMVKAVRP